ncbi:MAG: U32 family peptidase [Burkholderiaceae bacterium]|nr:U32 family peptidase [Ideonella sp.]MCC7284733.1 U32 family peptidase [Burkholderiaceae bacterium]
MSNPTRRLELTIGPLLYWWPRAALMQLYAAVAEGPARTVVLGEVVCSRRHEFSFDDWLALARDLAGAGKTVVLATQALVMAEAELRSLRRIVEQDEFAVEAGDASALRLLAQAHVHAHSPAHVQAHVQTHAAGGARKPFVIGPHINIYSRDALAEHAALGAGRWVAPVELPLDALPLINPPADAVCGPAGPLETEVFGFGRLPLAFSARCFTARHHRLAKDACEYRCRDDADGLLLRSTEGRDFLVLNGIQTQSAALHAVIDRAAALREAGVHSVRLSPCSGDFARVVALYERALNPASGEAADGADAAGAWRELAALDLSGELVNGFAARRPGLEVLQP